MSDIFSGLSTTLQDFFARQDELTPEVRENLYEQARDALERKAFLSIFQTLTSEEIAIYNDVLELDGEVDNMGFLSGIRSQDEARSLFADAFARAVKQFIDEQS